ncbi:MAG: aminopeptidase P family protein [Anaerolineaceae bacterium]|nr:aminopeptidase P family protein [Anaerolineaceae bacterium]
MYKERLQKLTIAMQKSGLDALALNPSPSLVHLTGLHFHLSERPVIFLYRPESSPALVLPELESSKIDPALGLDLFPYGENPQTWNTVFLRACNHMALNGRTIGVEPGRLRVLELRYLEAGVTHAQIQSAESALAVVRMHKDKTEIAAMQKAVEIAQQALLHTLPLIKNGISEREVASELALQLMRAGSDPELPFTAAVASGPNSANPHALPSDRKLKTGDMLVIDWGASYSGYCSDLTRTFCIQHLDPEFETIGQIVKEANQSAQKAVKPEVPAGKVDHAAREVIDKAGYGAKFTHRTGHGLGLEVHEHPYIYAENQQPLEAGMTFTIEPGIYLPGKGGVRIEDNIVVTQKGCTCLSDLPRDVQILD